MIPKVGCVVLTMGKRPEELARSVKSLLIQTGVEAHIVVAGNGWKPVDLPTGVEAYWIEKNIGATAGRNAGAEVAKGEYLLFLDDDVTIPINALEILSKKYLKNPSFADVYGFGLKIRGLEFRQRSKAILFFLRAFRI